MTVSLNVEAVRETLDDWVWSLTPEDVIVHAAVRDWLRIQEGASVIVNPRRVSDLRVDPSLSTVTVTWTVRLDRPVSELRGLPKDDILALLVGVEGEG